MKKLFLIAISFPLFATYNEPLRLEVASGYRNDDFHWHLQQPGDASAETYSEHYSGLQFWQNNLALHVIHRDLVFHAEGGYGLFARGPLTQTWDQLTFAKGAPEFHFDTSGWAAHGAGYFGLVVNLTADRLYKVLFIPSIGYSGRFLRLHRKGSPSITSDQAVGGSSYNATSHFTADEHTTWYGWTFGGSIMAIPRRIWRLEVGYHYHLLRAKLSDATVLDSNLFAANGALSNAASQSWSINFKRGGNFGHSGWFRLDHNLTRYWRFGILGAIHYYYSTIQDTTRYQTSENIAPNPSSMYQGLPEKLKMRWTAVSGLVTLSRDL